MAFASSVGRPPAGPAAVALGPFAAGRLAAIAALVALVLASSSAGVAHAHGMRSACLDVQELSPGRAVARLTLTAPARGVPPRPFFPSSCDVSEVTPGDRARGAAAPDEGGRSFALDCPGPLAGEEIGVEGLGPEITEAVVLVSLAGGESVSRVVTAEASRFRLPSGRAALAVARDYVRAGFEHIAGGADHLVFLLLLVLTLRSVRAVFVAETAFTASHALAFGATALGWVRTSAAAAEACIALSLVLAALDADGRRMPARRGALLALAFGAVHGLGFAGGLRELGLPERGVLPALVGFGVGVELGQLAFLAVALGVWGLTRRLRHAERVASLVATAIGGVAAYWLIERTLACFGRGA